MFKSEVRVLALYVQKNLPAVAKLREEGYDIIEKETGLPINKQNCLKILILNIMPTKIVTETQLLRLIASSGYSVDITLLHTFSYKSRNTSEEHISKFYHSFAENEIKNNYFDGLIITGAPVEQLDFTQVVYWQELCGILDWAKTNVTSLYTICWGAQAALYYYYNIGKQLLPKKTFGIFKHQIVVHNRMTKGLEKTFFAPHSRHTEIKESDMRNVEDVQIWADSEEAGLHLLGTKDFKVVCVAGHPEYDRETLSMEYFRDVAKGDIIEFPQNYFINNNPSQLPDVFWRENGKKFMSNWLLFLDENKR